MPSRSSAHPLLVRYDALVESGAIRRDSAQIEILRKLEPLVQRLNKEAREASGGLRAALLNRARRFLPLRDSRPTEPRGFYIWGGVGHGKSTLMELFYNSLETKLKRREHFNAFMIDAHERLHRARRQANGDPIATIASDIANETRVLCIDEFDVTDIADATILARLLTALLSAGVAVAATSNVEPAHLYEGGRNRELFLPAIALLQERLQILHLAANDDYRLGKEEYGQVYFSPANGVAERAIDELFLHLTGFAHGEPITIEVKRREIRIPHAAGRVARFDFRDICGTALGAEDYLALARNFDTIIVERLPALNLDRRNEARRFIALVDMLYDTRAKLVLSAETEAEGIYSAERGVEAQEFKRTVSRLMEMRSQEYLQGSRKAPLEETSE
jgi:cell division protein ZapE